MLILFKAVNANISITNQYCTFAARIKCSTGYLFSSLICFSLKSKETWSFSNKRNKYRKKTECRGVKVVGGVRRQSSLYVILFRQSSLYVILCQITTKCSLHCFLHQTDTNSMSRWQSLLVGLDRYKLTVKTVAITCWSTRVNAYCQEVVGPA